MGNSIWNTIDIQFRMSRPELCISFLNKVLRLVSFQSNDSDAFFLCDLLESQLAGIDNLYHFQFVPVTLVHHLKHSRKYFLQLGQYFSLSLLRLQQLEISYVNMVLKYEDSLKFIRD